ncbi:MAG: hypothetical protein KFF77_07605 [Bacteroidetes bacterium]|nr:hypothetical protein [Bacteroidota bacterium]
MSATELASASHAFSFARSRSIELGRTVPNWVRVTNSIARALEGSHSVEMLEERSDRLTLKLYRRHSLNPGWWAWSPTLTCSLSNDRRTLAFTLTWPEYGAAVLLAVLFGFFAITVDPLFASILVLPLLVAAGMFKDHERVTERIDDAVRKCLY